MNFSKNILVTGVSKGLGLAIATACLERGYVIYGISRTMSQELNELIANYPNKIHFIPFDLSKTDEIENGIFEYFKKERIPIHGLVNNAALAYDELLTHAKKDPLLSMIELNQIAPVMLTKYAIKNMLLHNTKGSMVHISSLSAHTGFKGLSMYAGTKGFLESFSKSIAREWGRIHIRSNAVAPGFMETEMSASLSEDDKAKIYKRTALKTATSLESVAHTVLFLLSDESQSITGQTIHVDGGTL